MVYFDYKKDDWAVKTWTGSGRPLKIFGDTAFVRQSRQGDNLGDEIDFYMAFSADSGKTWQTYDPSPAHLYCAGDPKLSNEVQLIVSNDFFNSEHTPSSSVLVQWKTPFSISGTGITDRIDFGGLCPAARKIPRK